MADGTAEQGTAAAGGGGSDGCLFCGIVRGDVPAEIVRIGTQVVAFRDVHPQAPLHVLVVPREHQPDVAALAAASPETLAELVQVGAALAASEETAESASYRLVFNTGAQAGQSVFHVHGHVLAGRSFQWPPG
jgi:histidine triad (HIT) family protein